MQDKIVLIGRMSSGKRIFADEYSKFGYNNLRVDSLIRSENFRTDTYFDNFIDNLNFYTQDNASKVISIDKELLECLPKSYYHELKDALQGCDVYLIEAVKNKDVNEKFFNQIISDNQPRSKSKKSKDNSNNNDFDRESFDNFLNRLRTKPTIYTLEHLKKSKNLLNSKLPSREARNVYHNELRSFAEQFVNESLKSESQPQ